MQCLADLLEERLPAHSSVARRREAVEAKLVDRDIALLHVQVQVRSALDRAEVIWLEVQAGKQDRRQQGIELEDLSYDLDAVHDRVEVLVDQHHVEALGPRGDDPHRLKS